MINDKQKIEKIYNYLSALTKAHESSNSKHNGWSSYNKDNKKLGFSAQLYYYSCDSNCKNMSVELHDVDFNHKTNFWTGNSDYKRIYIKIRIAKDFSDLEIKECMVKEGANLAHFFEKLDKFVDGFKTQENKLEQLLIRRAGE